MARITVRTAIAVAALLAAGASPASAVVAPKASIKFSPAKPVVGATLVLDARSSRCSPGPCRFLWTDQRKGRKSVKLGTAGRISVKLKKAETLTVSLRVTDGRKRSVTKRQKIAVAAAPVPAPAFTPPATVLLMPAPAPTVDSEAPAAPVIVSPAQSSVGNASTVVFMGTAEAGATIEIREGDTVLGTTTVDSQGTWVRMLTSVPDGGHTYGVIARDAAGNASQNASVAFRVDTTAPETTISAGPAGATNVATLTYTFASSELGSSFGCKLNGDWAPCQSPKTYTGLADGSYTFRVRATDAAGNTDATVATRSVTLDRTAPGAPTVSGKALQNVSTVALSGSAEAHAAIVIREDTTVVATTTADAQGVFTTAFTATDGTHDFVLTARDAAGNTSAGTSKSVEVDTLAPNTTIDAGPAGWTNAASLSYEFTGSESGATFECRLDGPGGADAYAPCTSPRGYTGLADGAYTFHVRAIDRAGHVDASAATRTVGLDTTPPETSITSGPTGLTNASPITFALSSTDSGSTFSCRLDRPGAPGDWAACEAPKSYTGLADGDYTFRVKAKDAAGNEDLTEALSTFALDRTAPAPPTLFAPALQNTPDVALRGTAEPNVTVVLREGAELLGTSVADAQGNWQRTVLGAADGTHAYSALARDEAGNESAADTRTVVVDTKAPTTTIDAGPPPLTNAATVRFEFRASEPGSTFACRLDRGVEPGEWAICDSPKSFAGLTDGSYAFLVRATDAAGNTEVVSSWHSFWVDRTAPAAPTLEAPQLQNSSIVVLSGLAEPSSTVELHEGVAPRGTASADGDGKWSRELTATDGVHTYTAVARDAAGNRSPASQRTVVVDTTAPTVAITSGPEGTITDSTATFQFTSETGAKLECRIDGPGDTVGAFAACTSPHTKTRLDVGDYTFRVRATDVAENTGEATIRTFRFTPPQHETAFIAPEGDDSAPCTQAAPCATLARAATYAADGGVIEVGEGSYGDQRLPKGEKRLTVRGEGDSRPSIRILDADADDATFRDLVIQQLLIRGSRQLYDGVDVDGRFARRLAFEHVSGDDVTFKNGSVGNVTDEKGVIVGPTRFTFDNVIFHDVRVTDQQVHNECVFASGSEGLTIKNSTFHACATMDLFVTNYEGGPEFGNITLENNVFEHTTMEDPDSWHFYTIGIHEVVGGMRNWVVRYNTFETGVGNGKLPSSGRWVGNVGDWDCAPGMVYRYNVGEACGELDSGVSPSASTKTRVAAFKWVNPSAYDFRLQAGSPAIDVGDPQDFPATDRDGNPRNVGWAPDAGAYERQQTTDRPDR